MPRTDGSPPAASTEEGRPARRGRRWVATLVAVAVLGAVGFLAASWVASGDLLPLDRDHGGEEVEQLDPGVADERGVARALADLHGHLNWAIWGGGEFDRATWLRTADRTLERIEDDTVAEALEQAMELVADEGGAYPAHGAVETAELRYADASG